MKRIYTFLMMATVCLLAMPLLQSCDKDDDHYSIGDFTPPLWATVRTTGNAFYLDCDVWGTLWPVNLDLGWYEPLDGQRVIVSFNPLWDNYEGFDHAVKILSMMEVLTKQIETLTPENEKELGNDPLYIVKGDLGISGGYLNVVFQQNLPLMSSTKHRISLVRPENDEGLYGDDGYIRLELRYNNYGDVSGHRRPAYVSFNLNSLNIQPDTKGILIRLNSEVNGKVELLYDLQSDETPALPTNAASGTDDTLM